MERCDFASIMAIIRTYISEDQEQNQIDLLCSLFDSFTYENSDFEFDNGLVCRWMNGQARISPKISGYYQKPKNRRELAKDLNHSILPIMSDSGMAAQKVYELIICDSTISESKKKELVADYPCADHKAEAEFLAATLCFGMSRDFVKRDARRKEIAPSGALSPVVADFIYGGDVPKPCRYFCGRDAELERLHNILMEYSKVFLRGIAGIGKSELAKAYAKQRKKEYTNILYIAYSGDLKQDILGFDFADDLPTDSEDERFRKHNRFLRSLKDDTLMIVDNFNVTADQDDFLSVMLKYRCRILFTSRNVWNGYTEYVLTEISDMDALLTLFDSYYDGAVKHREIVTEIIKTVHRHTLAVELAARLLDCGILKPKALLKKLQEEKVKLDSSDQIRITKDGAARKETYYGHIHTLFSLYALSKKEQYVMRNLSLSPLSGISAKRFAAWLELPNMNTINDLIEMGLVSQLSGRAIALPPMIQETALVDLPSSVSECKALFQSIQNLCLLHGLNLPYHRTMFQTVESIIQFTEKDDTPFYIRFLEDVFPYMEGYHYEQGMNMVLAELAAQLEQTPQIQPKDQAVLLDCRAAMEKNTERAIKLEKDAIAILGEVTAGTAHLASNLHANLGGLYQKAKKLELARQHMEQGLMLMEQYGLTYTNDSVPKVCNYAAFLTDVGQADKALTSLQKMLKIIREYNSDQCSDYAAVLETMGSIYLTIGEVTEATEHFKQAVAIYDSVWEDEPELIEAKYQEIMVMYPRAGINYGRQLQRLMKKRSKDQIDVS